MARPSKTDMNLDWFYEIYDYVFEQGYANRSEFCVLYLGKAEAFIRVLRAGKNYISADTAAYLAEALQYKAQHVSSVEAGILNKYADRCYDYIRDKAKVEFNPSSFKEI